MTSMEDHVVNRNGRFKVLDKIPNPFFIGVGGGTASGKSSVCHRIMTELGQVTVDETKRKVITISQDCFYRNLTEDEQRKARNGQFNFDHPDSLDYDLMRKTLKSIREGRVVHIPKKYDYRTHSRDESFETIYPADVVLFEGILVFYEQDIRELFDMKLFVDTDPDTRLSRRVLRDTLERDRDLEKVLRNYTTFVKPAFEEFCLPTKKYADVIIPRGADNHVAIDLIVQHIKDILLGSIATNGQDSPQSESRRRRTTSESGLFTPH